MSSFLLERQVALCAVRKAALFCSKVNFKRGILKPDSSPVTIADLGSQAIINHEISKSFPNDAIVGEEDSTQLRSDPDLLNSLVDILEGFTADQICALIDRGRDAGGDAERFWTLDPIDGRI
jgi:3'(2'), 5'-bisphosphate nucleotidase